MRPNLGRWMEQEIRSQPDLLAPRAAQYEGTLRGFMKGESFDCVLLAARGSSDHAALYARYLIEVYLEIPAILAAPSVWTRFQKRIRFPKCLCVGISQSGAAPDVSEVLEALREDGHTTLAITNTPGSRVTESAEHSLLLNIGEEHSLAATKTYTASLLAVNRLVAVLAGSAFPALPVNLHRELTQSMLEAEEQAFQNLGPVLRCSPLFVLGRGFSFATAHETALKLMECSLLTAKCYSTADFNHGPRAIADHGSAAVCYSEPPEGLAEQGCAVVRAPEVSLPDPHKPLADIFFGQWMALSAARARGIEPDKAQFLDKVTETL